MQPFQEILIIGMGLIGGSLGLALKKSGYKGKIVGYDLSRETLVVAKDIGALDIICENLKEGVNKADLIVMAVPVGYYKEVFQEIAPYVNKSAAVTDVGSVKGYVETIVAKYLPEDIQFLGGHPMAGSEKGGIKAATPFLFENAYYFLTPNSYTTKHTIERLEDFVKSIGAYPVIIQAQQHDKIVAQISHIPHLAAVLVANLLERRNNTHCIPFVGGGFRDTTRIAAGNPKMWRDIFYFNKEEVLDGINTLEEMLKEFKEMLIKEKTQEVLKTLEKAKKIRDSIPHTSRDYIPPIYDIIIDVEDRPGALGELTQLLGENSINIKEIEILHVREGERGAVRIGFATSYQQEKALTALKRGGFPLTYRKGENEDA